MAVKTILNLLNYYIDFEREEPCMDRHNCPAAETNKRARGHLIDTFLKLKL